MDMNRLVSTTIVVLSSIIICISCNKDEFESNRDTLTSFATIYAEEGMPYTFVKPYTLTPDGGMSTMYITKTLVNKKELTHQRRVIATYTLLKNVTPQNLADHSLWNIRLNQIMDLTCKPPILKSQTADPDQLGKGMLCINNIQFTGQYLNIEYEHASSNPDVNLWFDDTNHPASETWITSLCINASTSEDKIKGFVSFEMAKLFNETVESLVALNVDDCMPSKLILRYYESTDKQKELHYTINYDVHGVYLIKE